MRAREFTEPRAAGCIIVAEDTGRWCLQQRSDSVTDPGVWSTWGGGRKPGETLEQTVRRELAEEGGYKGPIKLERLHTSPQYATFIGRVPREFKPRLNHESKDWCWVEQDQLPEPMHPGLAEALSKLNEDADSPQWLYHATYRPLLKSIRAHGLGGDRAQAKWEDSKPGVVYLARDPDVAESYAESSDMVPDEWLDQIVVLKIRADQLDQSRLLVDQNVQDNSGDTLEYHGVIPVSSLSLVSAKQNIAEAFDQPYKLKWEKGEHGDYDALAKLDDGTNLSIMFNLGDQIEDRWMVEFYRNNSQALTGEGDAQRVFATVLTAVGQFIQKKKPQSLFFSAVKEDDPTGSRIRLYDRLVQRYASNLGYTLQKKEYPEQMAYELTRNQMQENFADGRVKGKSRPGRVKRAGASCKGSVTDLRARAKKYGGEKGKMYHWCANMKSGRKK